MPPAKKLVNDDARAEASSLRERQIAAAAHARSKKSVAPAQQNGHASHPAALTNADPHTTADGASAQQQQQPGMSWSTAPIALLDAYRVAHNLPIPTCFSTPHREAVLSTGIGLRSPTMARTKAARPVGREQLALAVRKHFNAAAVNEIDAVVDLLYKVKNKNKAFRARPAGSVVAKKLA